MTLLPFNDPNCADADISATRRFWLYQTNEGVVLRMSDPSNIVTSWNLLVVAPVGTIYGCRYIGEGTGLQTDKAEGRQPGFYKEGES